MVDVSCALQSIAHANDGAGAVANRLSTSLLSIHATNKVQTQGGGGGNRHRASDERSYTTDSGGSQSQSQSQSMPAITSKKAGTFPRIRAAREDDDEDNATHSMTMSTFTWNSPQSIVLSG